MKKFFAVFAIIAMLGFAPNAFACEGPECSGVGNYNLDVSAMGGGIDYGYDTTYNGFAGGIGAAGGIAGGHANSYINDGNAWGSVGVTAGGMVTGGSYDYFDGGRGSIRHTIGSYGLGTDEVGGHVDVNVDPNMGWCAGGAAEGGFEGIAGQATANASYMGSAPIQNSKIVTGGITAQGSIGALGGFATVGAGSDYYTWCGYRDQYAHAGAAGGILMNGYTESASYRGVKYNNGSRTEFAGTDTWTNTQVDSYGHDYDHDGAGVFSDWSYGNVEGGFVAGGIAANGTMIQNRGGVANSGATAMYAGSGNLNCNFTGGANTSTWASSTTRSGWNGSIMSSGASASVTATTYRNQD